MTRIVQSGAPAGAARLHAIGVHGRGRPVEEMVALGERIGLDDISWHCPAAPGGSWYPHRFIEETALNQPHLGEAMATIEGIAAGLVASGIDPRDIVLCGFSQGACLVAQSLVDHPRPYRAGLVLTGGLIGPPETEWRPAGRLDGVPVLISGSEIDEWIPVWRTRETESALSEAGARVECVVYEDREHMICDDEIERIRLLLR